MARDSLELHAPPRRTDAADKCAPGCDCAPAKQHLSWPKTLALLAVGSAFCFTLLKLFGTPS